MISIPGYQINYQIHKNASSIVFRGYREADETPVILKLLNHEHPSSLELTRFQQEYEITRSLQGSGIIDVYGLEGYGNTLLMVLEDFGGASLEDYMAMRKNRPLSLIDFLDLAIRIIEALGQVHQQNIIHKDINPANIIGSPPLKEIQASPVKLIDFGISTALYREIPAQPSLHGLEGTLAYMSPEQTGRMNRAIDYRTDFYSLGVTFYKLLTGVCPFQADDPLELVHWHLAKQPIAPHGINSEIPPILSEIVLKLMAKMAEDRYQSIFGLKDDLQKCRSLFIKYSKIEPFEIGQKDILNQFHIPQKLYGRAQEIKTLLNAFERVNQTGKELLLIRGPAGIGKSALVHEIHKSIVEKKGYFISGQFDQFQSNVPFSALIQAFQGLIRQLLTENEKRVAFWKKNLLKALGTNGQIIIDVIPEVKKLIGPQPSVISLPPAESQNRFNDVFKNFIRALSVSQHSLVIFLDDLHWADQASINLIPLFMTDTETHNLFLIGSYRDNEVDSGHSLLTMLDNVQKSIGAFYEITLSSLSFQWVQQLIADTFKWDLTQAQTLAEICFKKTEGNPFFLEQYLRTLYLEGWIQFNIEQGQWQANTSHFAMADNVGELITNKIQKLPKATQRVLTLAACFGKKFELQTLAVVSEKSIEETQNSLWEALQKELIYPVSGTYKFLHDHIQQAAYSLIPEDQKKAVHLKIGQLLTQSLQNASEKEIDAALFEIVNHLNFARDLLETESDKEQLAQLNLNAGKKTKKATAYQLAFNYLKIGIELLKEDCWAHQYPLALSLHEEAIEIAYLSGNLSWMEQWSQTVLENAKNLLDQMRVHEVKLRFYIAQNKPWEAVRTGLSVLALLGFPIPEKPSKRELDQAFSKTRSLFTESQIEALVTLPEMTDPSLKAVSRFLGMVISSSYIVSPGIFKLVVLENVNLSIKHGNAPVSPLAYVSYGMLLCGTLGEIDFGYRLGQLAVKLVELPTSSQFKPQVLHIYNILIRHWKEHLKDTLPMALEAYQNARAVGSFEYSGFATCFYCFHTFFVGTELVRCQKEVLKYSDILQKLSQEITFHLLKMLNQVLTNLTENVENPSILIGKSYDETQMAPIHREVKDRLSIGYLYLLKLTLCCWFQQYAQALKHSEIVEKNLDGVSTIRIPLFYFYDSLARLGSFSQISPIQKKAFLQKVSANQKHLERLSHYAPMNYLHKWHLVEAEWARVLGNDQQAMIHYEQAIETVQKQGYLQEEALTYELAAQFYEEKSKHSHMGKSSKLQVAQNYIKEARYHYQVWGAVRKVMQIDQVYSHLLHPAPSELSTLTPPSPHLSSSSNRKTNNYWSLTTSTNKPAQTLDLSTVIKALHAISNEIHLEAVLKQMLSIAMENAGAQKGYLLLEKGGEFYIEAQASVETETVILKSIALKRDSKLDLAKSILHYVIRTETPVVLGNAIEDNRFHKDVYIHRHQPKSILCTPINYQGRVTGLIYLENNLVSEAFTSERLEMLNLLSAQAAISIKNASLYQEAEKAREESEKARKEAEQAQAESEKAREEAEKAREEAEVANRSKGEFLSSISHEIRTPLNAVIGFSELLGPLLSAPKQKNYLEGIQTSGKSLHTLINSILDFSKVEAGMMEVHKTPIQMEMLFYEIEQFFHVKLAENNLNFYLELSPDLPKFCILDEIKLRQTLLHLVGNAIKFTEKGFVRLAVKTQGHRSSQGLPLTSSQPTKLVDLTILVEDSGIGIPQQDLERIFESFQQKEGQDNRMYGGAGLGLTLSKRFVELMGGQLTVTSQLNKGSIFELVLKKVETFMAPPPIVKDNHEIEKPNAFQKAKVLIVEDSDSNREMLRLSLIGKNLEVLTAINGEEGLHVAREYKPDVILMDIRMPVMDGYETTRRLKKNPQTSRIPVIAITTVDVFRKGPNATPEGEDTTIFDDFLSKPIFLQQLFQTISKYVSYHPDANLENNQKTRTISENSAGWPPEILEKVPELLEKLETEIVPQWTRFQKKQPMQEIKQMGEELQTLGETYRIQNLQSFGEKLIMDIENFDISGVRGALKEFPKLLEMLKHSVYT